MKFKKIYWPLILFSILSFPLPSKSISNSITDGKGIWLNIWNYPEDSESFCEYLKSNEIDTLYLQISRSNTPAIKNPEGLNKVIKSAHKRGIKVIGWTYPFLKDPISDARKFVYAASYKTPDGDMIDCVAADIEEVTNNRVIQQYSSYIRSKLGNDYPLIAITFSPVLKRAHPKNYAWQTIAENFDIIAPMTYWTWSKQYRSEEGAYSYTAETISKIKQYTKNSNVQIHLIGDGQKTSNAEIKGFLQAAKDNGIDGVSLYPWYKPTHGQVSTLSKFKI